MADTTSTTSFRADISQLKSAMQAAQKQVALANSEFKKATAGLDDWAHSAEGLQAKLKQLDSTLSAQKTKLELLKEEYEKTTKEYGENSAAALRVKTAMNNQEAAIAKTEKEIEDYNGELQKAEKYGDGFEDSLEEMNDASQKASDGFTMMKATLANLVADGIRATISALKDLAKQTLEAGMNFEQGMAQVAAVSGASGEELDALTEKAKEMGAKTKFSATESAEAFNYMAMAGWKTEDMINGIEGVMSLAAASGADLATTSDIVTDALTAMGYSAGDAGRLADVMAAASSNANTNVEMMGATFQYAAPIVGALGYSMEDTAVQIGLMANAGIKGQKAGTALRSILSRLSAPPKECAEAMDNLGISMTDAEGNMKSLDEVMNDLRNRFANMNETQQTAYAKAIAGQEAMSGLLAIVNSAPADYQKLTKAVQESEGAAASMANTMNDTVEGQLTLLKSQIEGIQIQIYENLVPSLKKGVQTISDSLKEIDWSSVGSKLGDLAKKALEFAVTIIENFDGIVSVMKSIGTVLAATFVVSKVAGFVQGIVGMVKTFQALKAATDVATSSQLLLNAAQAATPVGLVAAAVAGLAAGLIYLASKNKETEYSFQTLTESEQENIDKVYELSKAYEEATAKRNEAVEAINGEFSHYEELASELDTLVDANGNVKKGYEDRANFIVTTLNEAVGTELALVDGVIENYKEEKDMIDQLIESKKAEAILSANQDRYNEAIKGQDEALKNLLTTQGIYKQNQEELKKLEAEKQQLDSLTIDDYIKQNNLMGSAAQAADLFAQEQAELANKIAETKGAIGESRFAMDAAEKTYISYQSTIQNYEGLSAAIISGDAAKISESLNNMQNDFVTAETGSRKALEQQVEDFEEQYSLMKDAVDDGSGIVTQEMVDNMADMVDKAKKELDKAPSEFSSSADKAMKAYGDAAGSSANQNYVSGKAGLVRNSAINGLKTDGAEKVAGNNVATGYGDGIFANTPYARQAAESMGTGSVNSLNTSIDAHSPSQKTTTSGENFGQGFINGMDNKMSAVWNKAKALAEKAIAALKKGQQEGSPSKLTYKSGVNFVLGYINGIVSKEKSLQKTVSEMVTTVISELAKMSNYNFSTVAENASTKFEKAFSSNLDLMLKRIQYENEEKLKTFDKKVESITNKSAKTQSKLEKERDKKVNALQKKLDNLDSGKENSKERKKLQTQIKNIKNRYKKRIDAEKNASKKAIEAEKKTKESYQKASSEMLASFNAAMSEYQSRAQQLIDDTINGITDKYNDRYDDLMDKQNSLIEKLKGAGNLFDISGAGIMTVNDLKEQTKQITEYTAKLQQIKNKVSAELFNEIVQFDMKEGSAYIERLLSMSAADLEEYNKAFSEKMRAAEKAGENIYKSDFAKIKTDYEQEIGKAFADLPKKLEEIGNEAMQGFVTGLTTNTDYMTKEVKTYIKAMVDTFTKELKISSPSKVLAELGDYTGTGFVVGFRNTINSVKKAASEMASAVAVPLDGVKAGIENARTSVGAERGVVGNNSSVVNNYNLVQNNNSPKSLSALDTYRARRQQLAMVKALT